MAELLAATGYKIPSLKRGQEVIGTIVSITRSEILIDIGAKSEGIVSGRELDFVRDIAAQIAVGDQIEATVVYPENDSGQVVLSLRKISGEKRWQELEEKLKNGEDIDVVALEVNRGGIICDWQGLRGFLPASQLSSPRGEASLGASARLADLIGRILSARVIEVDRQSNRLILSQKQPNKQELEALVKLLSKIKIGQKVAGVVTAVLPFGIFVEINVQEGNKGTKSMKSTKGETEPSNASRTSSTSDTPRTSKLEGLVHISEISWEKVEDPARLFKVGDEVEVMVIAKDEQAGRLSLSLKQLTEDPFSQIAKKYSKDQEVTGTISRLTPFGVHVSLEGGIEGLIHISKIPPNANWQIGQPVECTIEGVDLKFRRISLMPVIREKPILYR